MVKILDYEQQVFIGKEGNFHRSLFPIGKREKSLSFQIYVSHLFQLQKLDENQNVNQKDFFFQDTENFYNLKAGTHEIQLEIKSREIVASMMK